MTVTFPAVVPNPCSYCNPSARQPTSANVESPFHRSLPARTGRCELSSCALGLSSSFAQLPQRHHRHSNRKKVLLVRLRSSAFDLDGDRGSLQKRFARNPASKFGVSSVSDRRDSSAPQEEEEETSFAVSRDLRPSANQHAASGSPSFNNQQTAFSLSQTRPRNSKLTRRQQTRSIDSLPASRLQNRLPVFKQAAEPDAFGTSFSPVHGADAFSSCNGQSPSSGGTLTQKSASFEEASSRSGSVFTSKLEEILNKFRTRETWSSSKDESLEVRKRNGATPSATQSVTVANGGLQATRSNANESHVDSDWRIARRDVQNSGSMGSISETSADETNSYGENIFSKTVHHHKDSLRETRQGMVKGNARGLYNTGNAIISNPVESSPPSPWERQGVRSPKSKRKTNLRKSSSNFAGAHAAKSYQSSGVGNKQRSSNSDSQEYPHWSTRVEKPGDIGKGSKPFSGSPNHNSDAAKDVVSEFDWTDSDEEDKLGTTSSITADDGASKRSEQLPSGSSMGVTTGKPKSLMNGNMAAWHSHSYPNLPFEFQYSYSETPKAPIIRYREEPYSPFGPDTMGRPWTGRPPLKQSKKKLPVFDSFKPPPEKKGIKFVQSPGPFPEGKGPTPARSREEILGEPLTGEEIVELVDKCKSERRQLNLGRDGLTHNMLDLIHCHWKRRRVVKVRCIGVPTVDMDNVCFHLEDKTGGKIIYRSGGSVYLFRGRNYNYKDRPVIPIMLWRPISPVYPKLIKKAPEGLTKEEADKLRLLGQKVEPLCTLGKNGVYLSLVKDVRAAFRVDDLVRINCRGLNPSDYKKIGGKLRDLVPCVLLSFDDEQILMWKGRATGSAKNVDVDDSSRMEAADCSELEDAKPSVACGVGDDEYCSAMEEIKQQALVDDTMGVSTGRSDCTILAGAEGWPDDSVATESINQMRQSTNDLCFEDFSDSSEVKSSFQSVLDAKDDVKYDKADPMPEQTTLNGGTSGIMPGHERESNTALDSQFSKSGSLMETSVLENDQMDGQMLPKAILKLDEKPTKLENSKDIGAGTKRRNDAYVVRVDALWDDAIASGIAIQLEEMDIDSDVVVKKVCELDKAVPAVAEYTRKLQTKLRIKKKRIPRPDDDLRIHFANLHKAKMEKKATKRAFRPRPAVDVPDNGGLPVDELARLLSMK